MKHVLGLICKSLPPFETFVTSEFPVPQWCLSEETSGGFDGVLQKALCEPSLGTESRRRLPQLRPENNVNCGHAWWPGTKKRQKK